ncbi:MAG: AAA family ATPase, partial [bacterium]
MRIYVAATRQNDGKTIVSMGLIAAAKKIFNSVGYIKPVGQQYKEVNGEKIDKDAILMKEVYNIRSFLSEMSPIAVPSGFTRKYVESGKPKPLEDKIKKAYREVSKDKDFVLIEGTGHAGVGSVFDL